MSGKYDDRATELYRQNVSATQISKILDIDLSTVYKILKRSGTPTKRQRLDASRGMICDRYIAEVSIADIAKEFTCSAGFIFKVLREEGLSTNRRTEIEYDREFFNSHSVDAAYHAGFGFADGCLSLSKSKYWIYNVTIKASDAVVLEDLCRAASINKNCIKRLVSSGNCEVVKLVLSGNNLPSSLSKWGIVPRKTYEFSTPEVSTNLLPHFLRGWIDGDGTVFCKGKNCSVSVACNHKEALEWFRKSLQDIGYGGNAGIYLVNNHYRLTVSGKNQVRQLCEHLKVNESFCLDRKLKWIWEQANG